MVAQGLKPEQAEVTMRPATTISLSLEEGEKVLKLLDRLEELDDVQTVYSNADFPDELFAEAEAS